MSNLFMDMHQRHLNNATTRKTSSKFYNNNNDNRRAATPFREIEHETGELPADDDDEEDPFANVLSLKLKKPAHWRWELSTSRSCTNIALPRILLYDHEGELLADVKGEEGEQVVKDVETVQPKKTLRRKRSNRSATSNLAQSIRQALDREFNGLQIKEATPSPTKSNCISPANTLQLISPTSSPSSAIDFYTNDLPDYKFERRSNSLKGVRFKEDQTDSIDGSNNSAYNINNLPTPPSTTTATTTPTNSSTASGPREKRRYRRSNSSGRSNGKSDSILERFSFNKGRFSSPEYVGEEQEIQHSPRYFLRTSKAGTLVVQEESFSRHRRRRRPKVSSSENLRNDSSCRNHSTNSLHMGADIGGVMQHLKVPQNECELGGSLHNVASTQSPTRKKTLPLRRYRSDGNVLLQKQLSTSEEEDAIRQQQRSTEQSIITGWTPQRKYSNMRKQSKKNLVSIDPGNCVLHPSENPTAR